MSKYVSSFLARLRQLRSMDWLLLLALFILVALGLSAIYSVELSFEAGTFLNMKKQVFAVGIGLVVVCLFALSNYRLLSNYALGVYLLGLLLLIGVLIWGHLIRGAQGWFVFGPVSFQPVEFMKVVLIIALATYFGERARRVFGLKELFVSLGITLLPVGLVLLQPDFGSAFILMGIWFIMTVFAGLPFRYFSVLFVMLVVVSVIAWSFLLMPYQKDRIITFIDPTHDQLGQGYNVNQAIIAIGAGGFLGRGLGFGSQSQLKFLPESQTDFIFAVIAEELGLFGILLVLGAFTLLFVRLFQSVLSARDNFTAYLLLGMIAIFFLQVLVNIGMNLGLFPVTGIGLPFVSYGGSSLVFLLILFGIAQSISLSNRRSGG
jgi:rod shape determining protein RodA